jgi:hypothetical protein
MERDIRQLLRLVAYAHRVMDERGYRRVVR